MFVYDGNCGFCVQWVERIRGAAGDRVAFAPSQEVGGRFPQITPEQFETAVQWIGPDGEVFSGAGAALRVLAFTGPAGRLSWWAYRRLPLFAAFAEACYRLVARNRKTASTVTRWLWGRDLRRPGYRTSADLFLRALAVIYLIAFLSFWVQAHGLIGAQGILPIDESIRLAAEKGHPLRFPTLFWFDQSDAFIHGLCGAGTLLAIVAALVPVSAPLFLLLWIGYLSVVTGGGPFLSFQWDVLLLEAGLLAVFLAPWKLSLRRDAPEPPRLVAWLYRWLLFRFMFASGIVKLTSGDATWRDLSALTYHYQTQPLPNPLAWYVHHLPESIHVVCVAAMFAVELAVPFFIFAPRRLRIAACALLAGLQLAIALTGNYTYFNLLAAALCLWLIDDASWPKRLGAPRPGSKPGSPRLQRLAAVPLAGLIVTLSLVYLYSFSLRMRPRWPEPLIALNRAVAPFNMVNNYGLFQVMTTRRPEIVIEGSRDGRTWMPYEFRYKPGAPDRRPPVAAPHQPRLDWQMWFAALGHYRQSPWFVHFCLRVLDGSPPVTDLLARNPFPDGPPRYLRAQLYDYRFTTPDEKSRSGDWWKRTFLRAYLPKTQLKQP